MSKHIDDAAVERIVNRITERHGNECRDRALEGVRCAASYWREEDGTEAEFAAFCLLHFMAGDDERSVLFSRLEAGFEEMYGSLLRVSKRFQWANHVDDGPLLPADDIMFGWDPWAHLSDDFHANKLAFVVHLNFPYRGLDRKLREGPSWSRREWAEARLGDSFSERVPAAVRQALASAFAAAESYIAAYNVYPAMLRDGDSGPLFPGDKRLLMHWNMRDEIKARYADPDGLKRHRLLYKAMERIVDGGIPTAFVDSRDLAWDPFTGAASATDGAPAPANVEREGDGRYEKLLAIFRAEKGYDLWCPDNPTLIRRRFDVVRQIPEQTVERLFHDLLSSPAFGRTAALASELLGRPLEPFDVWFREFSAGAGADEAALDEVTRARYPDARAFKADIPRILSALGFEASEAAWLAERIDVDQARGSGHAMQAAMRSDKARLRTRVAATGMDYKGFNIACHELGHNVEQVYSLHGIDEYFLAGVPNTAFTEAFAFVFQARDLDILGAGGPRPERNVLTDYWATCEIAAVGLVDMEVWRWMYANPDCDARDLRQAVLEISRSVWNRYFAPAFGTRDALALGVYSHMIEHDMYLPDYPLGHLIAFQVEAAMAGRQPGELMGRMCRLGNLTPGQWMREAVGAELSAEPMLKATLAELDAR